MYEFKLPDLGEGIHEGELLKWHVKEGDEIKEDDPLVEVETDKAAVDIPSPASGIVVKLNGKVGDIVNVGDVIAVIDVSGVKKAAPAKEIVPDAVPAAAEDKSAKVIAIPVVELPELPVIAPVPAAHATRRLARELGLNINLIKGSGPGGRVTPDDVRAFPASKKAAPVEMKAVAEKVNVEAAPETEYAAHAASAIPFLDIEPLPDFSKWGPVTAEPLRSIRRKVAHKMVTSMILVPHVAHMDEADVTLLEEFRHREKIRREG